MKSEYELVSDAVLGTNLHLNEEYTATYCMVPVAEGWFFSFLSFCQVVCNDYVECNIV